LLRASGFKALGVDLSLGLLEEAREQGAVLRADFRRLPLRDAFADGLFCECSLSLAEDKSAALDEFSRVLKAGGLLVLSDLFIDRPEEEPGPRTCLAGAVSEEKMLLLLERAGFRLLHRRDCGQALKTLAARLIWEFEVAALPETAPRLCRRGPERAGKASPKTACLLLIAGRA
jgi:SAM-dependent methyltransferase